MVICARRAALESPETMLFTMSSKAVNPTCGALSHTKHYVYDEGDRFAGRSDAVVAMVIVQ